MNLWTLYWLFVKIGAFTFGGGYAMIPLFQDELVFRHAFLTNEEFANMVALAQVTPGPVGLNAATYIGYQQGGVFGALVGTLGVMTPSLIIVTLIAYFMALFQDNPLVKALLAGIRPATLGLIAAAVIFFADTSVFSAPLADWWRKGAFGLCWQGTAIFALVLFVELRWKINMIYVLLGSALLSWLLFQIG